MSNTEDSIFRGLKIFSVGHFGHPGLQLEFLSRAFEEEGAAVHRCTYRWNKLAKAIDVIWHSLRRTYWADVAVTQGHGHLNIYQSLITVVFGKLFRRPVVLLFYGGAIETDMPQRSWAYHAVFRNCDAIAVASGYMSGVLAREGYQTFEIPHLAFESQWTYRHRSRINPHFISVRGFHPMYNPLMVMRAFSRLHAERPDAKLTMIGSGDLRPTCENMAQQLNLPVRFLADLRQQELAREMNAHDVFLTAPNCDNQPVCIIESMLCGLPVVATDVGGIPYMYQDGEIGFLVPRDDDEAMAQAVLTLLGNPQMVAEMSSQGHKMSRRFLWPSIRKRWEAMLEDCLKNGVRS